MMCVWDFQEHVEKSGVMTTGEETVTSRVEDEADVLHAEMTGEGPCSTEPDGDDGCAVDTGGDVSTPLSAKKLLKRQKTAVCHQFSTQMTPHYRTKFKCKV